MNAITLHHLLKAQFTLYISLHLGLKTYFVLSTCHTCCTFLSFFFFLAYFEFTEYFSYSNVVPSNVAPWKESYGKPRQCIKYRDINLPTKVWRVKGVIFLVVMYRCESCPRKKAECWKIDAFECWCWRKLLRVLWTARRSNQSILKETVLNIHWKDWLKLKLQYFGHLMQRADSLEKTLMLGKIEGKRRREWQRIRWLDSITTQWTWNLPNSGR